MKIPTPYRKEYAVRYYEIGDGGALKPRVLLDYLQDAAAEHAAALGVGMEALLKRNLSWVLSRLRVVVARYPGPAEKVCVSTWPSSREGISSHREYEVFDEAGALIVRARSLWVMIDVAARRPVRIDPELLGFRLDGRRAVAEDFSQLPAVEETLREERFAVRRDDLDVNRHLNNAVFAAWALESAPDAVAGATRPVELEIVFRAEALAGEAVVSRTGLDPAPGVLRHGLVRERDGRELARLRTRWA
jgi:acyl-ACP thioesterase